ncbi:MAG: hypothetical protein ABSD98_15475 [Candidatus Korobacteraceae bacterium]|jgi:hypothetical protein
MAKKLIVGKCELCLEKRELQDSHLIGRAIYRHIREDEGEDPIVMTPDVVLQTSRQVSDYVFCKECEDRFNRGGEHDVTGLVWRRARFPFLDRINLSLYRREGNHAVVSGERIGIDTDKLAYYAVSVVWRAAVHVWRTIGQQTTSVFLAPDQQENLRRYLVGESPLPENASVVVTVCADFASQTHCLYPTMLANPGTYQDFWLLVRGLRFNVMVADAPDARLRNLCCVCSPGRKIFVANMERETVEAVRHFHTNAKVARNIRARPQLTKR